MLLTITAWRTGVEKMKLTKEKVEKIAENLGWNVAWGEQEGDKYVTFSQYSPAGEDFSFDVWYDILDEIPMKAYAVYVDFDIDEHIEMWLEAKRNGVGGVPSARVLVIDAEEICGMIYDLCEELRDAV